MGNRNSSQQQSPSPNAVKFLRPPSWEQSSAFALMSAPSSTARLMEESSSTRSGCSPSKLNRVPSEVLSIVIGYTGHDFAVFRLVNRRWYRAVVVHLEDYLGAADEVPDHQPDPSEASTWVFKDWAQKNKYILVSLPGMSQVVLRSVRAIDLSKWYLVSDQSLLLLISLVLNRGALLEARRRIDPEHEGSGDPFESSPAEEENIYRICIHGGAAITDGSVMEMARLTSLTELDLSKCNGITDRSLKEVAKLPCLKLLDLSECHRLTEVGLTELGKSTSLQRITLRNCSRLSDQGVVQLSKIPTLTEIDISWSLGLGDESLLHLATARELKSLFADGCFCSQDKWIQHFTGALNLQRLSLAKCNLIDDWVMRLTQVKSLEELSISRNPLLTNRAIRAIAEGLPHLRQLDVSDCPMLSDEGLTALARSLTTLSTLNLSGTGIADKGVTELSLHCSQLAALFLQDCRMLTDASLIEIPSFPKLVHLSIRFCEGFTDDSIRQLQSRLPALCLEQEKAVHLHPHADVVGEWPIIVI